MGCCSSRVVDENGKAFSPIARRPGARPSLEALRNQYQPGATADVDRDKAAPARPFLRSGSSLKRVIEKNAVLVVTRVRPLNQRESQSSQCIEVKTASSVTVSDVKDGGGTTARTFTFDACFRPDATQDDVYSRSGRMVLGKVLQGFNGCVFAYGQTGSGKTYTMIGTKEQPGVIPRMCEELFDRISSMPSKKYRVELSMCEIYNEKLHDLLADGEESKDLAVREDVGGRGVFVDGLLSFSVESAAAVHAMIESGQRRRAVGKTNMNEYSSRSHSVVTLTITSRDADDVEGVTEVECKLHLVDLAGSERQKATGATGDRLKEGAQINLSLSALGNVISALTDAKKKGGHVPYRDSKLTRLLSDSLGGNSVTVMLCNVSPAKLNADETVSALRFAERAKKLENVATIARDPKAAKAAALFAENKALKERVAQLEAYVAALEQWY